MWVSCKGEEETTGSSAHETASVTDPVLTVTLCDPWCDLLSGACSVLLGPCRSRSNVPRLLSAEATPQHAPPSIKIRSMVQSVGRRYEPRGRRSNRPSDVALMRPLLQRFPPRPTTHHMTRPCQPTQVSLRLRLACRRRPAHPASGLAQGRASFVLVVHQGFASPHPTIMGVHPPTPRRPHQHQPSTATRGMAKGPRACGLAP